MGDCALTAAGAETKVFRPWAPAPKGVPLAGDLEAELRRLLDEAILACLPARGVIACELSGGLNSTTVLAFARKRREALAITFASGAHPDADDVRFAREAAQALGARQLTLDSDGQRVFDRAFAGEAPEPGSEMFAAKLAAIDRLLSDNGVDVLLTGWAGDVVFGSAAALPHHLADGIARGRALALGEGDARLAQELSRRTVVDAMVHGLRLPLGLASSLRAYARRSRPLGRASGLAQLKLCPAHGSWRPRAGAMGAAGGDAGRAIPLANHFLHRRDARFDRKARPLGTTPAIRSCTGRWSSSS